MLHRSHHNVVTYQRPGENQIFTTAVSNLSSFWRPWNFPPFKWVHPSLFILFYFLFYYHFIQHYYIVNGNFKSLVLPVQKKKKKKKKERKEKENEKHVILFFSTKGSHDGIRRLRGSVIRDFHGLAGFCKAYKEKLALQLKCHEGRNIPLRVHCCMSLVPDNSGTYHRKGRKKQKEKHKS